MRDYTSDEDKFFKFEEKESRTGLLNRFPTHMEEVENFLQESHASGSINKYTTHNEVFQLIEKSLKVKANR